jgi:MYXO-CTERM domain-containing protein
MRKTGYIAAYAALMLTVAVGKAFAGSNTEFPTESVTFNFASPEISPASISGGLALLAAGVLLVRARRSR